MRKNRAETNNAKRAAKQEVADSNVGGGPLDAGRDRWAGLLRGIHFEQQIVVHHGTTVTSNNLS